MALPEAAVIVPDNACEDPTGPTLSPQQVQQWKQAGYAFVNGVLPPSLVARIRQQADRVYSKLSECQQPGEGLGFPFLNTEKYGQLDAANDVPLHPRLIGAVSQLLDVPVDQIMLGQAELWCKIGEAAGADGWAPLQNQDQRMHMDYPNHYLTHPAPWHSPDAVTAILYLDDIAGIEGGTGVVPRRGDDDPLYATPYTMMPGVADIPWTNDKAKTEAYLTQEFPDVAAFREQLYPLERCVHYNVGSLLLYRYDLWHRGRPILPAARRIVMNLAWRKRSCAHFITSWQQGWAKSMYEWPQPGRLQNCAGQFESFVCRLSDTQRALLGFPPMGDAYWTEENVNAVKKRYGATFQTAM